VHESAAFAIAISVATRTLATRLALAGAARHSVARAAIRSPE
jgi:hypothetical protein